MFFKNTDLVVGNASRYQKWKKHLQTSLHACKFSDSYPLEGIFMDIRIQKDLFRKKMLCPQLFNFADFKLHVHLSFGLIFNSS